MQHRHQSVENMESGVRDARRCNVSTHESAMLHRGDVVCVMVLSVETVAHVCVWYATLCSFLSLFTYTLPSSGSSLPPPLFLIFK